MDSLVRLLIRRFLLVIDTVAYAINFVAPKLNSTILDKKLREGKILLTIASPYALTVMLIWVKLTQCSRKGKLYGGRATRTPR